MNKLSFTRITTKDLVSCLIAEVNFKCSSAFGKKEVRNNVNVYVVWSYNTIIAIKAVDSKQWILNAQKYSQTTSRLQNAVRKAANEIIPCDSEEEFQDCVYKELKVTI
jgi:hypothetical protein